MALADHITFFAATDTGRKRKHNEDNFLVDHELGLYVVADGMGGHAAGEVASAIAVRTVHEVLSGEREMLRSRATQGPQSEVSSKQLLSLLDFAIQTASQRIHSEAQEDPRKRGMGTTISLLLVLDSYGYVAHVGDSRVYLMRGQTLHQVTEDHTVANELIRLGMVTPDQLDKVPRKNAITRAVGVYAHAEVDTVTLEMLPNDQFLLASDGLCGYFDDNEAEDMRVYLGEDDGDSVVKSLIDFANAMGGKDNITALLVRVGGGDNSDSVRARRVALKREMLAQMPLFSRLNERELLRVMQIADVFEYERGEVVVNQGEHGERMFVALAGKLEVVTGNQKVAEYGPGEHFGEMALIRSRPRSATIRALERSEVISLKRDDFFDLIRVDPHVAVKLLWQFLGVIANRLEVTSRDLSKALGEKKVAPRPWVDDEPSLDPFTSLPGVNRLSFHPPPPKASLNPYGDTGKPPVSSVPITPQVEALSADDDVEAAEGAAGGSLSDEDATPAAADAPAIAQRTDSPSFEHAPAIASRVNTGSGQSDEQSGEFDARSTVPRAASEVASDLGQAPSRPAGRGQISAPARQRSGPTAVLEQFDDEAFDKRKTLPGRKRPKDRVRHETLKSADSVGTPKSAAKPATGPASRDTQVGGTRVSGTDAETSAPSDPHDMAPAISSGRLQASTQPDGKLREARTHSLAEDATPEFTPTADPKRPAASERGSSSGSSSGGADQAPANEPVEQLDNKKTIALPKKAHEDFRPTKRTIPLEPTDSLRSELDALRKEFKERLKKSRRARKAKDSD